MSEPLLDISRLSVHKAGHATLDDISLSVRDRDFITIIGPNGAGKTTLLKCIIGLNRAYTGVIRKRRRLRIGYVPQHLVVNHLTPVRVSRFLALCQSHKTDAVIDMLNLSALLDKPLGALSGGEEQRVLLARALCRQPQLLILDEPAQNLDISRQLEFYSLLERVYRGGQFAVLMVSHDIHMVMRVSHNVVCLYHHICCSGKPQELSLMPEFIALYGEEAGKVLTSYQHHHNHTHT